MTHTQLGERADATTCSIAHTYMYVLVHIHVCTRRLYSVRLLQLASCVK